jgi:hypothetical protein
MDVLPVAFVDIEYTTASKLQSIRLACRCQRNAYREAGYGTKASGDNSSDVDTALGVKFRLALPIKSL